MKITARQSYRAASTQIPLADVRGLPSIPTDVKTIRAPSGVEIRYKEPGICESTPGVRSYAGYVSLNETMNMFFWFFEARKDPHDAPFTLWLNGGPGADSMIGLFQENGPCNITEELTAQHNPYSWNEVSNMLYLSEPIGVGFSYESEKTGCYDSSNGKYVDCPEPDGRYAYNDPYAYPTTDLAAAGAWQVLQGLLSDLPQLDPDLRTEDVKFNLWTESYGGHYGPAFYNYFYDHNEAISNGTENGTHVIMDTLGIINGIVDIKIQAPSLYEFAVNNTYGIKSVNDTVYTFMKQVYSMPHGCSDYVDACAAADRSTLHGRVICATASNICHGLIRNIYTALSGRGTYDIRHPHDDPTPADYFIDYLNQASIQAALGVDLNYTSASSEAVATGFHDYGDYAYPTFKTDLEEILDRGVRVALFYGDADFTCNWFGGETVSLALNYSHAAEFAAAGYAPFVVDGEEYGAVRQYGNFSFARIYESGHEIPYYQPKASLEFFRRTLGNFTIADGMERVTEGYKTNGTAKATHTEAYVPLPTLYESP
ncbi:peptidase S10, serine carboxypeptidase [Saccharata proteae CBS 121410]|uniref:Carboxypeptidase n=1 Tax=Saccharata proteae CBS 121410 TaxID=1314787 RepID=A0A9P4I037_9PEZI|nr:peptidase S10, serine carboxypeptidase [Saccharata proteae CBS 121410]